MILSDAAMSQGWLKDKPFDLPFIFLIPVLAILAGYVCVAHPPLFRPILVVNLWLLGYHHVISTYTRIAFSAQNIRNHKFLVFYLPFVVLFATGGLAFAIGSWIIPTVYLYWQWFHYTRQSYGVSRFYMAKTGHVTKQWHDVNTYALYLLPLAGILYRSYQSPETFLFMEVKTFSVAYEVVMLCVVAAITAIGLQIASWIKQRRKGTLSLPYVYYMLSHHVVFAFGYLLIEDINYGWLVINMWHNAQYIGFVWMINNKQFNGRRDENNRIVSAISQDGRFVTYIGTCVAVTIAFYWLVSIAIGQLQPYVLVSLTVVAYMTINFHHYVVDAIIWRRRKKRA